MTTYEVTSYSVSLGKLNLLLSGDRVVEIVAGIRCGTGIKGGPVLDIGFIPNETPLPPNPSEPLYGSIYTTFRPLSEYVYYLDLLRNEKPIEMTIDEKAPYHHGIRTGQEKIGEGEPE
jgi:hypothetical protein